MDLKDLLNEYYREIEYTVEYSTCDWESLRHYKFSDLMHSIRDCETDCCHKVCDCCCNCKDTMCDCCSGCACGCRDKCSDCCDNCGDCWQNCTDTCCTLEGCCCCNGTCEDCFFKVDNCCCGGCSAVASCLLCVAVASGIVGGIMCVLTRFCPCCGGSGC